MNERRNTTVDMRRSRLIIWIVMAVLIFGTQWYQNRQKEEAAREAARVPPVADGTEPTPTSTPTAARTALRPAATATRPASVPATNTPPAAPRLTRNVVLRDQDGEVIYRGEIDLAPALERIAAGRKLRFPNDGGRFQNREGRLPGKPPGYYTEWVVPTPGDDGPGPQRMVVGADGDVWYTRDHYRSFERISTGLPKRGAGSSL